MSVAPAVQLPPGQCMDAPDGFACVCIIQDLQPDAETTASAPQQQPEVLVMEVQDRFGCLFLDFRGTRWCTRFGLLRLLVWAARGVLPGLFIGKHP